MIVKRRPCGLIPGSIPGYDTGGSIATAGWDPVRPVRYVFIIKVD